MTLLEQGLGQQLNICALDYKKVNDQPIYLYGGGLLSEAFPLIPLLLFSFVRLHINQPPILTAAN